MTLSEQSRLSFYHTIAALNEDHGVYLVQHSANKRIFVKKILVNYNVEVFQWLKKNPVSHTPRIRELIIDESTMIIIEDYIPGRTLQEILEADGCFSEEAALSILEQICRILKNFHSAAPSIIHRDLKPSNIILSDDGTVTLLDMDAAKLQHSEKSQDTRLIGTRGFAAPEQYGFGSSDVRTDIFSLGVLLNIILLGVFPQEKTAPGFSGTLISKCTRIDPDDRYASVDEILILIRRHSGKPDSFDPESRENPILQSYLPPGFRSHSPIRIIPALIGYSIMTGGILSSDNLSNSLLLTWVYRIAFLISFYLIVLLSANYRNIWHTLCLDQISSRLIRILMIIILDFGLFGITLVSSILTELYIS